MCRVSSIFALFILISLVPEVEGHQLFNSEEQKIAGYRIQVATDPEIPGPGSPSRLMVVITDSDGSDLVDVRAGVKVFKNDLLIHEFVPMIYTTGHIDLEYTFPESGVYIVEVGIIDLLGKQIYSKFNIGIVQTFGYIFFAMIVIGAMMPPTIIGIIYVMKRKKARKANS